MHSAQEPGTEKQSATVTETSAILRLDEIWIPFGDHPLKLERYRED